jgi:hypothetical protein
MNKKEFFERMAAAVLIVAALIIACGIAEMNV